MVFGLPNFFSLCAENGASGVEYRGETDNRKNPIRRKKIFPAEKLFLTMKIKFLYDENIFLQ
ncbi:hypothetical protein [Porphyromonas loveana]|uniref:Uncharacterized protein n=1 Tax=Porphyromonas loveana TaxID=1884669 RepID=A0A2U1F828_9PORP|nr:hypothetical protein C7382_11431 [Porphyromonas loveana]